MSIHWSARSVDSDDDPCLLAIGWTNDYNTGTTSGADGRCRRPLAAAEESPGSSEQGGR